MKKGMELAINTLVIIILGIVILGAGFAFLNNIRSTSDKLIDSVKNSVQADIKQMFANGALVAIPDNVRKTTVNKKEFFGVGIKNIFDTEKKFIVKLTFDRLIQDDGIEIYSNNINPQPEIMIHDYDNNNNIVLGPNQEKTDIPFLIKIPSGSKKGTYIFNIITKYQIGNNWVKKGYPVKQVRLKI